MSEKEKIKFINADDAIANIKDLTLEQDRKIEMFSANWIIGFLESFPAARDLEISSWYAKAENEYLCTRCLSTSPKSTPFCPFCGAKMKNALLVLNADLK